MINGATTANTDVLQRVDFATTCFVCNAGNLLEATIQKATSLTGNGSTANPLAVKLSADAGNDIIFGTDGGIFYDFAGTFLFNIVDGAANTQPINVGNSITFLATGAATAVVSATDTVTIGVALPTISPVCPSAYFVGAPV